MSYKNQGLRIGVLLLDTVQLLDAAPVDLLGMLSAPYMRARDFPPSLISLALENVTILYISPNYDPNTRDPSASFAECTAESALRVTRSLTSPDCGPGALDILLIPGPPTSYKITPDVKDFVRAHTETEGTTVMTVCVGVYVAAQAGILDGKTATAPLGRLAEVKERFKHVNWIAKRWISDGNIWSSGGITNGNDMVAAFLRERYPGELSKGICEIADVGDRGVDYPKKGEDRTF